MRIKNSSIFSFLSLFFWKFICDYFYPLTFDKFSYYGIELDFNIYKLIETYFVILISYLLINFSRFRNTSLLLVVLLVFQIIPLSTYYAYANESAIFFRTIYICFFIFLISNRFIILKNYFKFKSYLSLKFLVFIGILIVATLIFNNGLPSIDSFNLFTVYERRNNFISNSFIERLNSILVYVISPILLIYSIISKNKLFLIISIIFSVIFFLLSGGKYAFFLIILTPLFYFAIDINDNNKSIYRLSFFVFLFTIFFFSISSSNQIGEYLFNQYYFRTFITPAWLSFVYYNVFQTEPFYNFSETFGFMDQRKQTVPELIGDYLFYDSGGSFASNGMFGDAYANLGIVGIIIISFLFSILIVFLNSLKTSDFYKKILPVYIAVSGFFLINSSFLSLLSSRGFIIGIFFILILNEINDKKNYDFK